MRLTDEQELRFWSKVKGDGKGCVIWTGARRGSGYGNVSINGRNYNAHRIAWMLVNGREPKPGAEILHRCDNRLCVNPRHLREGTHRDNVHDMIAKGRQNFEGLVKGWKRLTG